MVDTSDFPLWVIWNILKYVPPYKSSRPTYKNFFLAMMMFFEILEKIILRTFFKGRESERNFSIIYIPGAVITLTKLDIFS